MPTLDELKSELAKAKHPLAKAKLKKDIAALEDLIAASAPSTTAHTTAHTTAKIAPKSAPKKAAAEKAAAKIGTTSTGLDVGDGSGISHVPGVVSVGSAAEVEIEALLSDAGIVLVEAATKTRHKPGPPATGTAKTAAERMRAYRLRRKMIAAQKNKTDT